MPRTYKESYIEKHGLQAWRDMMAAKKRKRIAAYTPERKAAYLARGREEKRRNYQKRKQELEELRALVVPRVIHGFAVQIGVRDYP